MFFQFCATIIHRVNMRIFAQGFRDYMNSTEVVNMETKEERDVFLNNN